MCCLQRCQFASHVDNERVVGPQVNGAHTALKTKPQPPVATLSTEPLVSLDITLATKRSQFIIGKSKPMKRREWPFIVCLAGLGDVLRRVHGRM